MPGAQILVVDDEIIVAENIRGTLRGFGYSVPPPAISGEEAVRRVESSAPDLVVIDIHLGGPMDGVVTAREIKSRRDIPLVYLTAYADDETLQRALATEPFGYLVKPFAVGELRSTIEMALFRHDLERKLKDTEARYRAIVEEQTDLILRFQPDGTIVFANSACRRQWNRPAEDLTGQNFLSLIASDERQATREALAALSRKNPVATSETCAEGGNGRNRRIWWVYSAIHNGQGHLAEIQAAGRDITNRWQAEEALRQRNAWLGEINRASQTFVSTLDLDVVLTRILEALRQQLKAIASSVWLTDQHTAELVCHYATEPNKKVVLGWRLAPGQGIAGWVTSTGRSLIVPDVRRDLRHFKQVDEQTGLRIRSMVSVPLRVQERVIGAIEVMDTTPGRFDSRDLQYVELLAGAASIAIENAYLYREADRLRSFNEDIVQSMDEGIMLENEAGSITFVNPRLAHLVGCRAADLVGRRWTDVLAPDQVAPMLAERERWPRDFISRYETVLESSGGDRIPVMVGARSLFRKAVAAQGSVPDHPGDDRCFGTLSVFTDIRELKRAEQTTQRRLAAEELIADVSTRFINQSPESLEQEIVRALTALGGFAAVDCAFLDLVADDGVSISTRYRHSAHASEPSYGETAIPSLLSHAQARERMLSGEPVHVSCASALPPGRDADDAYLQALGCGAVLCVPVVQDQRLVATVGFGTLSERPRWSEEDVHVLRLLGDILVNALTRRRAEEQIEISLREREVLLKEVHQRVNNNLQVICSLLDLQANAIEDAEAGQAFQETHNRIRSMALIHERLYRSPELGRVDAADFVEDLTREICGDAGVGRENITVSVLVDHVELDLDVAIPLALVINELVSDAVRHAFAPGSVQSTGDGRPQPQVGIELRYEPARDHLVLRVSDNGAGLAPGPDWRPAQTLGPQLVRMLTEQLGGVVEVDAQDGTTVAVTFPAGQNVRRGSPDIRVHAA